VGDGLVEGLPTLEGEPTGEELGDPNGEGLGEDRGEDDGDDTTLGETETLGELLTTRGEGLAITRGDNEPTKPGEGLQTTGEDDEREEDGEGEETSPPIDELSTRDSTRGLDETRPSRAAANAGEEPPADTEGSAPGRFLAVRAVRNTCGSVPVISAFLASIRTRCPGVKVPL